MSHEGAVHPPRLGGVWVWLRRIGLAALAVLLVEYLVVPRVVDATTDLDLISSAAPVLLTVALAFEVASLACYTAVTRAVLSHEVRPRFLDQFRIDVTGLGASHVLPGGGASAAALRFRLMTQWGVPAADAASATALQTVIAAIGLITTFVGGVVLAGPDALTHPAYAVAGVIAAGAVGGGVLLLRRHARRPAEPVVPPAAAPAGRRHGRLRSAGAAPRALSAWAEGVLVTGLAAARSAVRRADLLAGDPRQAIAVTSWAAGNWLLDAVSLWVCLRAYGLGLQPGALLMAYGAANLVGLLPVTPGGIGIVEGVLIPAIAGLADAAVAPVTLGVLTWRLLQFWLPIPVSGLTYASLRIQRVAHRGDRS